MGDWGSDGSVSEESLWCCMNIYSEKNGFCMVEISFSCACICVNEGQLEVASIFRVVYTGS